MPLQDPQNRKPIVDVETATRGGGSQPLLTRGREARNAGARLWRRVKRASW